MSSCIGTSTSSVIQPPITVSYQDPLYSPYPNTTPSFYQVGDLEMAIILHAAVGLLRVTRIGHHLLSMAGLHMDPL
jgi:hypothetical protein